MEISGTITKEIHDREATDITFTISPEPPPDHIEEIMDQCRTVADIMGLCGSVGDRHNICVAGIEYTITAEYDNSALEFDLDMVEDEAITTVEDLEVVAEEEVAV